MDKTQRKRSSWTLTILILLGLVYGSLLRLHVTFTGMPHVDGILGVMIGLYACVQPAVNGIDALVYGRYYAPIQDSSRWTLLLWWALNLLVLLVGLTVIFTSLLRYSGLN
jgi:hypothetical protein